jgi:hypothetical protein
MRRFLALPASFIFVVIAGQFVGAAPAYGDLILYPLNFARIRFDLSGAPVSAPYTQVAASMRFAFSKPLGAGDGFTAQLFDSANHEAGDKVTIAYTGPDTTYLMFYLPLYGPFPEETGTIVFSQLKGRWGLQFDQYVQATDEIESTGEIRAQIENVSGFPPVPEPATYGLFAACGLALVACRRKFRRLKTA